MSNTSDIKLNKIKNKLQIKFEDFFQIFEKIEIKVLYYKAYSRLSLSEFL
jgi:hypothetical protein